MSVARASLLKAIPDLTLSDVVLALTPSQIERFLKDLALANKVLFSGAGLGVVVKRDEPVREKCGRCQLSRKGVDVFLFSSPETGNISRVRACGGCRKALATEQAQRLAGDPRLQA